MLGAHETPRFSLQESKIGNVGNGDVFLTEGVSMKIYLHSLATLATNKPLTLLIPCNDRHFLAAGSPPRVIPFDNKLPMSSKLLDFSDQPKPLVVKIFKLSASDIAKLINNVMKSDQFDEDTKESSKYFSRFNVIAALIWKCMAQVNSTLSSTQNQDFVSTFYYAVDIRSRLHPPLSLSYIGNAALSAYAAPSTCKELQNYSLRKVVGLVSEGAMRITDEYVRCFIDSNIGDNKGGFFGECIVTNWCNLGLERVEYPWGRPKYYCPLDYRRKDYVVMFPSMQNEAGSLINNIHGGSGINIFVTQSSSEEMNMLERHLNELLREYTTIVKEHAPHKPFSTFLPCSSDNC